MSAERGTVAMGSHGSGVFSVWRSWTTGFRAVALGVICGFSVLGPRQAFSADFNLDTDYQNLWLAPSPAGGPYSNYFGAWPGEALTHASTAVFHGHALGGTNAVAPSNAACRLEWSAFGQPVEGLKADVALGEVVSPPAGTDTNVPPANFAAVKVGDNAAAYYECQDPVGGAFWVPSTRQVIAAQPNNVEIRWRTTGGGTNVQVVMVGAVPLSRPARLFWTETPYDAPKVNLQGLFPVIHPNAEVSAPVYEVTTNINGGVTNVISNVVSGVWIDDQKQIHAKGVSGMFVLEYYKEGSYKAQIQPDGIEVVQVLEPEVQVLRADIGSRLLPADSYWAQVDGNEGVVPAVQAGLNETAYAVDMTGPKDDWVFSIQRTVDDPWSLEIYWQHPGLMGVLWPYEVDWYECEWPAHPQVRVISASPSTTAAVLIPDGLTALLMPEMDPPGHAGLSSSGKSLMMSGPGRCLMKYTTSDNIWFEVVQSVSRTNAAYFDLDARDWDIGEELRPPGAEAHALAFDGTNDHVIAGRSWLNQQTNWTLSLWFQPGEVEPGPLYTEGDPDVTFEVSVLTNRALSVALWNRHLSPPVYWKRMQTPTNVVQPHAWQHLAVTLTGGDDSNGTVRLMLDGQSWETNGLQRVNFAGTGQAVIGAVSHWAPHITNHFFRGRIDEVRIWNAALTEDEIRSNRYAVAAENAGALVANYAFDEGAGSVVHNEAGGYDGTLVGDAVWCYGQIEPGTDYASFPGYLYEPAGNRYNVNRYAYPTESQPDADSSIFAVNTNLLEVWWANRSRQEGMPTVYYPSWVNRYRCVWPTGTPEIVIASGRGSNGDQMKDTEDALDFDGVSDAVVVADSSHFGRTDAMSLEAWVRLDSLAGRQEIAAMAVTNGNRAGFSLGMSNDVVCAEFEDAEDVVHSLAWGGLKTGEWTHVAVTYRTNDQLAGYVNGRLVARQATGPAPLQPATAPLVLGAATALDGGHLDGRLAEVRMWGVARTDAEIAGGWLSRPQGGEEGLIAYYPFDRGTNDVEVADGGTNGLDGVNLGALWAQPGRPVPAASAYLLSDDSIYAQNDPTQPGYNPNEEHALVLGGVAYALRDDLNVATSSAPFVLVDYLDPDTARPKMALFGVVRTNREYRFEYALEAGLPILPPMPLGAMPPCTNTYSLTRPPAWRDRKLEWWAAAAGDDGGGTDALMHFYYAMQPGFYFPLRSASAQPAIGTEIPWLPTPPQAGGTAGEPVEVDYAITWPSEVPGMKMGQTLTHAAQGLPDLWDQLSVESIYQQSAQQGQGTSVKLFDPVAEQSVDLSRAVVEAMVDADLARQDLTDAKTRFPALPPSLYPRLFYDPDRGADGQLVLEGQYVETLTGGGYLLLNMLEDFEKRQVQQAAEGLAADRKAAWDAAVEALPGAVAAIAPDEPFVHAAAYAGLGKGVGYVTLAFNNSTNARQVPAALPVSLAILRVEPELYEGSLEVIESADVMDEQLSLRCSPDFAGRVEDYEFQWRWTEPEGGLIPNTNFPGWNVYGSDPARGSNEVTIGGASLFTMADHYFAVRHRRADKTGPTGTNWSSWTYGLAPGWVQRVMNGINPFEQCQEDMLANAVDTRATMISLAGGPYEGDIALNLQAACDGGLVPVYQTVLNRAMDFSIRAGMSDEGGNQTLLFAASRLHDLYMLLGNEAYADAQDPTLAFPRALYEDEHGAEATGLFCFMNQMPNLLAEELALLRGRDDTLEPSVRTGPVYNRLIWNFTKGINGGEAAYAYTYNIRGAPTSTVGTITAEDAKRLYPQGHGDAWGHYLSALMGYYQLLSNSNFVWHTEPGATLLGNATVSTDFMDEQKFAEAAAAKARTGVEIVHRAYLQAYEEVPTARWAGYADSDTHRAWGLEGWASRTGQGAYYDWATAHSLLLDNLTNMTQVGGADQAPEGIQKIDRTTVPELQEIAESLDQVQQQIDQADGGMNPLGLARGVVPFDISPTEIDAGKTHFEQIYDRALKALYNACIAFDYARGITLKMREQFDSVYDLQEQLAESETEFHNQLVRLYGRPYPDDVGPGCTYPEGYEGPDLVDWPILDLEDMVHNAPTGQPMQVTLYNYVFTAGNDFTGTKYKDYTNLAASCSRESNAVGSVSISVSDSGLRVKPASWTGRRPAQGELQLALSEVVQGWYALEAKIADYDQTMYELEVEMQHRQADYSRYPDEWSEASGNTDRTKETSLIIEGLSTAKEVLEIMANGIAEIGIYGAGLVPEAIEGVIGPFPVAGVNADVATSIKMAFATTKYIQIMASHAMEAVIIGREGSQARWDADLEELIDSNTYQDLLHWTTLETQAKLKAQYVKQAEVLEQVQALAQQIQEVRKLLSEGEHVLVQRAQVRARAAQRLQMDRCQDLSFRIFRDDALRRYRDTFDLAARYVYLAAKAYDYETGLLDSDTQLTPGSQFLEAVVKARLPGRFYVWLGEPQVGIDEGEPGLADVMARMKADWEVVKGRFGFNNPETETSRFSLRTEHFRIAPASGSDGRWAAVLENECKVEDLRDLPEFQRYCIPFQDSTNAEPGLVIPFSTMVVAGKNYFGHDLAGGDNAYDATHQATKIRSAGVWFTGYNMAFNTNATGGGLANEPRVYLLPVGEDVMRSPTREGLETRHWKVLDQALPLPYDIGSADLDDPDFQPVTDSLTEPLARIRRFASLRAYHDKGQFDEAETHNNGRLIGRSVWNTKWLLIIPGRTLLADPEEGIERFIHGGMGADEKRDGNGVKDIKVFFQTYSIAGE